MDPEALRLVRAIAQLERTPTGIHPVGWGLERRLCQELHTDQDHLHAMVAKAEADRFLVHPGEEGPRGERRLHPYHLSAKGWGMAAVMAS